MPCHSDQQVRHAATWRTDARPYAMADKPDSWREHRETLADAARRRGGRDRRTPWWTSAARSLRTRDDIADDTVNYRHKQPFKTKALRSFAPWCLNCLLVQGDCQSSAVRAREAAVAIPTGVRQRALLKWLAPDLAMTFALVTLFSLFYIFGGARTLFGDTDTGWHILNGETILSTGHHPAVDPHTISKPHQPWIAWEWGADVLMGAVSRVAGLAGIALMYGLAISVSIWMWFRLNRAAGGNICRLCLPLLRADGIDGIAALAGAAPHTELVVSAGYGLALRTDAFAS